MSMCVYVCVCVCVYMYVCVGVYVFMLDGLPLHKILPTYFHYFGNLMLF